MGLFSFSSLIDLASDLRLLQGTGEIKKTSADLNFSTSEEWQNPGKISFRKALFCGLLRFGRKRRSRKAGWAGVRVCLSVSQSVRPSAVLIAIAAYAAPCQTRGSFSYKVTTYQFLFWNRACPSV
ncbi:hypothetical protein ABZP36_018776 [Zizania latifolia]